tara:strand:- start:13689 stop:14399 length:711 start_codon:yes stop_codon:yes gene_type:complete
MIYFHHFHKSAGSAAVKHLSSKLTLPDNHVNGNMIDQNNHCIEFWNYDKNRLNSFLETFLASGNTLLIAEWGIPNLELIKSYGFKTITIIREPKERLWSNYCFDVSNKNYYGSLYNYIRNPVVPYSRRDYYNYEARQAISKHYPVDQRTISPLQYFLSGFDEIITLENGIFSKSKNNTSALDFSLMPRSNVTKKSRLRSLIKKTPKLTTSEATHLENECEDDIQLYESIKKYTTRN